MCTVSPKDGSSNFMLRYHDTILFDSRGGLYIYCRFIVDLWICLSVLSESPVGDSREHRGG